MFYIYPFITFGTVALNHYNLWVDKEQADGNPYKNQNSAFGAGLGFSYRVNYLDIGFSLNILFSSATSNWRDGGSNAYIDYTLRHTLMNYMLSIPVGLSYPIASNIFLYAGFKPIFGISRLSWYDSVYAFTDLGFAQITSWGVRDAGLGSSSFGLGFSFGGDVLFSGNLGLHLRFGYDVINFKNYEGELEERYSDGTVRNKTAYLVYDKKDVELSVKDRSYDPSKGEVPGEENLSGFRFDVGLKIGLGK